MTFEDHALGWKLDVSGEVVWYDIDSTDGETWT